MSEIARALDLYKERVIKEARESLDTLKKSADTSVNEAIKKLENLVDDWQAAASKLNGLGIATIADISLQGGAVATVRVDCREVNDYYGHQPVLSSVAHILQSAPISQYLNVDLRENDLEIFVLAIPVPRKAKS